MTYFKGAEDNSYNVSWVVSNEQHPDVELESDLSTLRERSHQLIRDNLVVSGMQQTYINYILNYGPTIYSASTNRLQRTQINNMLEDRLDYCDSTGTNSLHTILDMIVAAAFSDGDILINLPVVDDETVVELIEAFRVDTPNEFKRSQENSLVRNGVKYNANGKIVGFYVRKQDRLNRRYSSTLTDFDFFPVFREFNGFKRRVTQLFKAPAAARPLASRQYPLATPMIPYLKNLNDYAEAVLIGARVAACFSAFITTENPSAAKISFDEGTDTTTNKKYTKLQPGQIFYLNRNEAITFASPNKPGDNHDTFVLRSYKTISMAYRIPYILAFLDPEQVSYSGFRGAVLESHKLVKRWRRELGKIVLWIVNTMVLEGISNGSIRGTLSSAELRIRWPSPGVLDSEKEGRGDKLELENKTKSRQMICDEKGYDYTEVLKDREEEALQDIELEAKKLVKRKELEEKLGIEFTLEKEDKNDTDVSGDSSTSETDTEKNNEKRKEDGNW